MTRYRIEGARVDSIPSLYDELNRVFMSGEQRRLGASLDALDDLLYGGYGALADDPAPHVLWSDHAASRDALGIDATVAWLRDKLARPEIYRTSVIAADLDEVLAGRGATQSPASPCPTCSSNSKPPLWSDPLKTKDNPVHDEDR